MKRMLWVLLMMSIGATYPSSMFPVFQEHFQLSNLQLTLLFAIYAAFLLPTLLIVGARGNAWGLKKVLRASVLLSLVSTVLFGMSAQAWELYLARLLEGIAYGAFTGTAIAFLLQQSPKNKSGMVLTFSSMILSFGFGLGPAISGFLIQYVDFQPLHLPFWLLVLLLLSAGVALESLSDSATPLPISSASKITLGVPTEMRSFFWSSIALPICIAFTLNGIVFSLIPTFAKTVIHTSNLSVSGLLILLLMGGGALVQLIKWPKQPLSRIRFGMLFLLLGTWVTVSSGEAASLGLLWVGIFLQAIGTGWTFQTSLKLAGSLPKPDERSQVITTYYLAGYSGFIVPVVAVGALTIFFELHTALLFLNGAATLVVAYIFGYSVRYEQKKAHSNITRSSQC